MRRYAELPESSVEQTQHRSLIFCQRARRIAKFSQDWITGPAWDFFSGYSFVYMSAAAGLVLPVTPVIGAAMAVAMPYANSRFLLPLAATLARPIDNLNITRCSSILRGFIGTVFSGAVGATVAYFGGENATNTINNRGMFAGAAGFLIGAAAENLSKFCMFKHKANAYPAAVIAADPEADTIEEFMSPPSPFSQYK